MSPKGSVRTTEKLYGTKQVAEILEIPDWRVKNFAEGEAYRLPPSRTIGTGRGSRRLYTAVDIAKVAIANELVGFGFSPEAVGEALGEITNSLLAKTLRMSLDEESRHVQLVCDAGKWRLQDAEDPRIEIMEAKHGMFFLDIYNVLADVAEKLRE